MRWLPWLATSTLAHVAAVAGVIIGLRAGGVKVAAAGDQVYEVDLLPAKGSEKGKEGAKGKKGEDAEPEKPPEDLAVPLPPRAMAAARVLAAPADNPADADPGVVAHDTAGRKRKKLDLSDDAPEIDDKDMAKAVRDAMLAKDGSGVVRGDDDADPKGQPDGDKDGKGAARRKKVTAQYRGMLAGWFRAHLNTAGLNFDGAQKKKISSQCTFQIAPSRAITGASCGGSSGHAGFDSRVKSAVASIKGGKVPEAPPDADVPSAVAVTFRPR